MQNVTLPIPGICKNAKNAKMKKDGQQRLREKSQKSWKIPGNVRHALCVTQTRSSPVRPVRLLRMLKSMVMVFGSVWGAFGRITNFTKHVRTEVNHS